MILAKGVAKPTTFRLAGVLIEIDDDRYRVERLSSMYLGFTKIDGTELPRQYRTCPQLQQCSCPARQRGGRPCKHLRAVDRLRLGDVPLAATSMEGDEQ